MSSNMKPKLKSTTYILTSALFFGTYGVWSRLMGHSFGEFNQAWTRGLILLIFVLIVSKFKKLFKPISKEDWPWFIIIAIAGGLNQAPYYFGFQHLSIGTATLLFYAALVFGGYLIGKLVFNEKINRIKIISLVISLAGMGIIYQFSLTSSQILPATLTIIAGLLGAICAVLPKKLSSDYHEFQIMTGYFSLQIIFCLPLSLLFNETLPALTNSTAWLAQLAYATSLLIANFTVIEGFKQLDASIGSLIGMAEILFGVLFGFIFFSEILTPTTLIGGALIILAATLPNLKQTP